MRARVCVRVRACVRACVRRFDSFTCLLFLWWIPPLSLILMQMKGSPGEMVVKIVVYHTHASESYLGHSYRTGGGDETCAISGVTVTNALNEFTEILSGYMRRVSVSETEGAASVYDFGSIFVFSTSYHIRLHNGSSNDLQQIKESFRHNQT